MISIQLLSQDLSTLLLETKRRNIEVRNGCDLALNQLKTVPSLSQLSQNQNLLILQPILLSCKSDNLKLITTSIHLSQKLILAKLIPVLSLPDLLNAFTEASNLAMDIQLRILQCLPGLLVNYNFTDTLLLSLLTLCTNLTTNKSTVVMNTASATLQQLFSTVFDRVDDVNGKDKRDAVNGKVVVDMRSDGEVNGQGKRDAVNGKVVVDMRSDGEVNGKSDNVGAAVDQTSVGESAENEVSDNHEVANNDVDINQTDSSLSFSEKFQIFQDLCNFLNDEPPKFLKIQLKKSAALEIIENVLLNHKNQFNTDEFTKLIKSDLIPLLVSTGDDFLLFIRLMRIVLVLLSHQFTNLDSRLLLTYLNQTLLDSVKWKKTIVLEVYKTLLSDYINIKHIFNLNDKIINELFSILLTHFDPALSNSVISPFVPPQPSESNNTIVPPVYLGKYTSNARVSILDHLDKLEPPSTIPPTYDSYLSYEILLTYSNGISRFVSNLSNYNQESNNLEAEIEFSNSSIISSFPSVSSLFEKFIYSRLDSECFHLLIRAFQRFSHTTGLLGLTESRDALLSILSNAIMTNESEILTDATNSSYLEQGRQLFAYGEAIVDSFTGSEQIKATKSDIKLHSRAFNSRQIICLRALSNLASSLGSTLQDSWSIVWITFQWCNYYINGPDEQNNYFNNKQFKKFTKNMLPKLTQQDLQNFSIAEKKCLDSVNEYPENSLYNLFSSLIELTNRIYSEKEATSVNNTEAICPYNQTFFVNKLLQISKINSNKFFIESDDCWNLVTDHFIALTTKRTMNYNLRLHLVGIFNEIIRNVTREGFASEDKNITDKTATSTLDALIKFLHALINLGPPKELLLTNCEIEIFLSTLSTVHDLIDKYDTFYQNSWDQVFEVVNTPIVFMKDKYEDKATQEKMSLLINSAYDTLKLILDEFMSTLPSNQLKLLIETSYNYLSQLYDLNVSFLSVSYFWLISDSLKDRILKFETVDLSKQLEKVKSKNDLLSHLETLDQSSYLYHITLDLYLLTTLGEVCHNDQAQVRDGAIQTFFQILELHGDILTNSGSWNTVFSIAIPTLLALEIDKSKETFASLELIIAGLTSLYTKFDLDPKKWKQLIEYFERVLSFGWIELNIQIFKTFNDLISRANDSLKDILFQFWSGVKFEYDLINKSYQDYLIVYMQCFPELYKILSPITSTQLVTIVNALNKCAMYPIMPTNQQDNVKLSSLQDVIISNIELIDTQNEEQEKQLLQFLATLVSFPITLRTRLVDKFEQQGMIDKFNIPTFNAFSHTSLKLLQNKLDQYDGKNMQLFIKDKTIHKLVKSLNEVVAAKLSGFDDREWIDANQVTKSLTSKLMQFDEEYDEEIWKLIINSITINFTFNSPDTYQDLIDIVLKRFLRTKNVNLIKSFIKDVYENSFLYEFNSIEESLLEINFDVDNVINYDFDESFGTTTPLVKFPNQIIRFDCLSQLIGFCKLQDEDWNEVCGDYLLRRLAICLRRYLSDLKLLNKCPMPQIQQKELRSILSGLIELSDSNKEFAKLRKLLFKLIPLVKSEKILIQIERLLEIYY